MNGQIDQWIEQVLKEALSAEQVLVGGDGRHYEITVVSAQ